MGAKLFLTFLFTSLFLNAQSIDDSVFEEYLETHNGFGQEVNVGSTSSLGDGIIGNGFVNGANIQSATILCLTDLGITNLDGIELFGDLQVLICNDNNLESLDLSLNSKLNIIGCNNNNLESLTFPNNPGNINSLECQNNQLNTLDVSGLTLLERILCRNNSIEILDFSNNKNLEVIACKNNSLNIANGFNQNLSFLDASFNPSLKGIQIDDVNAINNDWTKDGIASYSENCIVAIPGSNFEQALIDLNYDDVIDGFVLVEAINTVTNLNVANNEIADLTGIEAFTALEFLEVQNNNLTTLDLSLHTSLVDVYCFDNQSISLNIKNGNNLNVTFFVAQANSNLTCIQVDDESNPIIGTGSFAIDQASSFSEDCSGSLSINDLDALVFSLYPNPSKGNVTIDVLEAASLIVYNTSGKEV